MAPVNPNDDFVSCAWLGCVCGCEGETPVLGVFLEAMLGSFKGDLVTVNISREVSGVKTESC